MTRAVLAILVALLAGGAIESACADRSRPATTPVARPDGASDAGAAEADAGDAGDDTAAGADAATSPDAAAGSLDAASSSPCLALCARVDGAGCAEPEPCPVTCQATLGTACGDAYAIWASCAGQQPASSFHCDSRNRAALDATLCGEELRAFGDCLLFGR